MSNVRLETHGSVAELRMDRNSLNTIDPFFLAELDEALEEATRDESIGALVLSSGAEKFFSAGFDLGHLLELEVGDFRDFYRSFVQFVTNLACHPVPTIAAVEGFAIAGGGILAFCCDWRIMTEGKARIGLNEVDLGVPMPLPATLLVKEIAGWRGARDVLVAGRLFDPAEALERGLVDELAAPEAVVPTAIERAQALAAKPLGATAAMKRPLRAEFAERCEEGSQGDEVAFLDAFFHPDTRQLLFEAAEKLVPR